MWFVAIRKSPITKADVTSKFKEWTNPGIDFFIRIMGMGGDAEYKSEVVTFADMRKRPIPDAVEQYTAKDTYFCLCALYFFLEKV